MKKLIIATNNAGKVREIKQIFSGVYDETLSLKDAGIVADVVEDGETFLDNARKKAREISLIVDCDVLADDSGLMVKGLDGAPGVYSARYSGENATDDENNAKLISAIASLNDDGRQAKYVCCMALYNKGLELFTSEGECKGIITEHAAGENGFGYDPYFFVPEYEKTMAELSPELKNSISHRGRALRALRKKL